MRFFTYKNITILQFWLCIIFAVALCFLPKLILNILLGVLFILSVVKFTFNENKIERKNISNKFWLLAVLPFIILVLLFLYDIGSTYNISAALKELEKKASFLIFPLIIYFDPFFVNKERLNKIIHAFAAGCLLVVITSAFYALYRYFYQPFSLDISSNWDNINKSSATGDLVGTDYFFYKEFLSLFSISPVYFSTYLIFAISILFYLYFYRNEYPLKRKFFVSIGILLLFIALVQLSVRGIIIPFSFFAVFFLIKFIYSKTNLLKTSILVLLAGLIFSAFIFSFPILKYRLYDQIKGTIINYQLEKPNSIKLRFIEYDCAWGIFTDSPILGFGDKKSDALLHECLKENLPKVYQRAYNAHNQFLQYLIQIGIIGLTLFLIPLFFPMIYFDKGRQIYFIFLSMLLISFLSESVISRFYGFMFMFFLYIVILSFLLNLKYQRNK